MPGKPGFRVHAAWRRPDAALLAAFGTASPAQVADSMSRLGAMDAGIRPVWPSPRIIGAALTVWCHTGDNLMLHKALSLAEPGDIVVMNTQGNVADSGFGELVARSRRGAYRGVPHRRQPDAAQSAHAGRAGRYRGDEHAGQRGQLGLRRTGGHELREDRRARRDYGRHGARRGCAGGHEAAGVFARPVPQQLPEGWPG